MFDGIGLTRSSVELTNVRYVDSNLCARAYLADLHAYWPAIIKGSDEFVYWGAHSLRGEFRTFLVTRRIVNLASQLEFLLSNLQGNGPVVLTLT